MCDASFIPIQQIKKLLDEDLKQSDYIALRKEIERNFPEIESEIEEALENEKFDKVSYISELKTEKDKFERRLKNYANAQIKYASKEVSEKLLDIGDEFLKQWNSRKKFPLPQLKIKDHLLTLESHLAGYYATWILDIGLKSRLFAAISEAPLGISAEELSWKLGLTPLYVEVWCRAAYSLELLEVKSGLKAYSLAPGIKELLLDPTHPTSMRFDIAFGILLHQDFLAFPTYLRTGARWPIADRPAELRKLYVEATQDDYPVITDVILPTALGNMEVERLRALSNYAILDVGTGAGFALIHYAERFPKARVSGIDINPVSVAEAQRMIQVAVATNLGFVDNKIEVRCQDVNTLPDKPKYNLIVVNLVLYEIGITEYPNVFKKLHDALEPGGIVVVSEYNFPDLALGRTFRFPGYQSFLSHLLHFALTGATMVPSNQLVDYMKKANFKPVDGADDLKAIHHPLEERQVIVAKRAE
jgi:SAM-dependent methyltransferase